jgi:CO/xanthine dehydrogenase FAD-binding subunit
VSVTDFFVPRSLDEALSLLTERGSDLLVMGGGTVMMMMVNDGLLFPRQAMSLRRAGMDGVRSANNHVEIGATTSIARISQHDSVPLLAQAARLFGGPAIRHMATVGGNLFVPQPAGDMAVPLLALDAEVELASAKKRRRVRLDTFLAGQSARADDELLTTIHVPVAVGRSAYLRMGRRESNTPSIVAVAVRVVTAKDGTCTEARIALGAARLYAMRASRAEAALVGQRLDASSIGEAAQAAMDECDPFTDALASAWYRRKMVGVHVRRALEQVMN